MHAPAAKGASASHGLAPSKAKPCTKEGSRQQAAAPKSEMHTSQRVSTSRSSTFGALTSRCAICEHAAHIATKDGASPRAGVVGAPYSMAHNSRARREPKSGSSLVRVNDTQARRHVSENVQHVGDLVDRSKQGEQPCYRRWACLQSGPGRADPSP